MLPQACSRIAPQNWNCTLRPCTITIQSSKRDIVQWALGRSGFNPAKCIAITTKPPALLHINIEARQVALGAYKLSFDSHLRKGPIWFNPESDSLFIKDTEAFQVFFPNVKRPVEHDAATEIFKHLRVLILGPECRALVLDNVVKLCPGLRQIICKDVLSWVILDQKVLKDCAQLEDTFRDAWVKAWGEDAEQPELKFLSKAALNIMTAFGKQPSSS
ncbi:hypothetical protein N431DRAFT_454689 [Stipitochalara longipes BDJ]|nr:hypothetical protein N431DRAFT_454689 [Stipitochalara longipes BDJ]